MDSLCAAIEKVDFSIWKTREKTRLKCLYTTITSIHVHCQTRISTFSSMLTGDWQSQHILTTKQEKITYASKHRMVRRTHLDVWPFHGTGCEIWAQRRAHGLCNLGVGVSCKCFIPVAIVTSILFLTCIYSSLMMSGCTIYSWQVSMATVNSWSL